MYTDADIMQRIKSGQIEKLGLLFERYKMPLYAFFYRNTICKQTSEDLVQNVFFRILKYRNSYSERGSFKTWMYQIAHHVHIDHYRQNKKHQTLADPEYDIQDEYCQEDNYILDEELKVLQRAMSKLDPEKRELLVMAKYQNLEYLPFSLSWNYSQNLKI